MAKVGHYAMIESVPPGKQFGFLKVIGNHRVSDGGTKKHPQRHLWVDCECVCGKHVSHRASDLRRGKSTSCGCKRGHHINTVSAPYKHGGYRTKLYRVLHGMIQRCENENCSAYPQYGAKGIKVCNEWRHDFDKFREWSNSNGYKEGLTIDRIDSTKDYCPENCQWITRLENSKKVHTDNLALIASLRARIDELTTALAAALEHA